MKILKVFILFSLLMTLTPNNTEAHPGRTDGNGGHTCRTNCTEKWGIPYGDYHYHNGGGSSSSSSNSNTVKKSGPSAKEVAAKKAAAKKNAEAKKAKEIAQAEEAGYNAGLKDGYNNTTNIGSSKYQGAYNKGYKKGNAKGVVKLSNEKNKAYRAGYIAAEKSNSKDVPSAYKTNSLVSDSYIEGYERFLLNIEKQKYFNLGYEAAFALGVYKEPELENENQIRWYKEGFEANKEAKSMK